MPLCSFRATRLGLWGDKAMGLVCHGPMGLRSYRARELWGIRQPDHEAAGHKTMGQEVGCKCGNKAVWQAYLAKGQEER